MNVLLIAGAGTSIELGVPGMIGLAEEFLEHSRQWNVEPALVERILDQSLDIEHLIEELDHICAARGSLEAAGELSVVTDRFDKVRAEIEWFIQHAAERIVARDAYLMWGGLLRTASQIDLTLVTTNYDRAIELAANADHIDLDDGFGSFEERETALWEGFGNSQSHATLVKLHGSTDWYADIAGSPTKLRHPMPLFGRATLQLTDGNRLGSALILPSREKLLTRNPYPRLSQTFLNATDACDIAVVVGSSLRDHHIRGAAQSAARRVPTFIVNPAGDNQGIEDATAIAQSASQFLIGTLTSALRTTDPAKTLSARGSSAPVHHSLSVLRRALDADLPSLMRCQAVEELDRQGALVDSHWVRQLISGEDPHVARYALSLIVQNPEQADLIVLAEESGHRSAPAYEQDLALLRLLANPLTEKLATE